MNDRAEREFNKILRKQEYVPALVNMGNIYYLKDEMKRALAYYERAYKKEPHNSKVLLCVARVNHELENYGSTRDAFIRLKHVDPD